MKNKNNNNGMKIYVLSGRDYDVNDVLGTYSSREDAEVARDVYKKEAKVDARTGTYDLSEYPIYEIKEFYLNASVI
jgi:hypothetical protein